MNNFELNNIENDENFTESFEYESEGFVCTICGHEFKDNSKDMGGICEDCYRESLEKE
ncbi:MAG: hypothetical protein Q3988_04150 [Gemella sp.]|nr:hypothetical protein [Gemella sp.]